MSWTNYHSHYKYCDGVDEIEQHINQAIAFGLCSFGFTSHSPVHFENKWSMDSKDLPTYLKEVDHAKTKYAGQIEIYKSLEIDYFPEKTGIIKAFRKDLKLDYTLGSIHFIDAFEDGKPWEIDGPQLVFEKGLQEIYGNDIQKVLRRYFEITVHMLEHDCPNILGHMDKIKMQNYNKLFFDEEATWYKDYLSQTLEVAARSGTIVEVNTRGLYKKRASETYPGKFGLQRLKELKAPICLNSDSHHPREIIGEYENTALLLKELGFKELMVLKDNVWLARPFGEKGVSWE
ncbi:histidinol-phosphatase [Cecembia sp.]|uniref:histidinol-phosphatase n=1 Tax=Cecembia sp. TaxID=1898110 RepID=UPI0025C023EE|nr:histidinol-phosphatase [Cecembia sp.]